MNPWKYLLVIFPITVASLQAAVYCVVTNAVTPSHPYDTWGTAYTNIQDALNAARSNDTIYLAGHTFALTSQLSWTGIASHVTVRGGYAATNPSISGGERDSAQWPTVIRQTGSDRVMAISKVTNGVLDQVVVTGGNPPTASSQWNGVGLSVEQCRNFLISSCVITSNRMLLSNATKRGGGIYSLSNDWLVVSNCLIRGNQLSGNTGGDSIGGGVCNSQGKLLCVNTEISSNSAARSSTGAAVFNYGTNVLVNCLVYGNTQTLPQSGNVGIIQNFALAGGRLTIENCTVVSNSASVGVGTGSPSVTTATNSIFWSNTDDLNGAASLGFCAIQTTDTFWTNNVNGCFTNNPLFAGAATNNFRLTSSSPCKDTGTNLAWVTTSVDLEGKKRKSGLNVDIGAYELQGPQGTMVTFK